MKALILAGGRGDARRAGFEKPLDMVLAYQLLERLRTSGRCPKRKEPT